MSQHAKHRITVCTQCPHRNSDCKLGLKLIRQLDTVISLADGLVDDGFEISGTASVSGCNAGCTFAYHATLNKTYVFGGIDPEEDIYDLVAYADLVDEDGWCSLSGVSQQTVPPLRQIPAAVLASSTQLGNLN